MKESKKVYQFRIIRKMWNKYTQQDIANFLNIGRTTVSHIGRTLGLAVDQLNHVEISKGIDEDELIERYAEGLSRKGAAEYFNVTEGTIIYMLRRHKLKSKIPKKEGIFNKPEGWNPITNSILIDDLNKSNYD